MRRLDKTRILSTKYKDWVDQLERENLDHPGESKYRVDVVMNLFYCQGGICAYTEIPLCPLHMLDEKKWENGRYKEKKVDKFGSLDHFNPDSKTKKSWKWENLFMVHTDINSKKGAQEVDEILKPDLPGYDPFKLLSYSDTTHMFSPSPYIEDEILRERIDRMIDVLQLNHGMVRDERESFFKESNCHDLLGFPWQPNRFFTAYEMVKAKKSSLIGGNEHDK
jgi:hypothetical protein